MIWSLQILPTTVPDVSCVEAPTMKAVVCPYYTDAIISSYIKYRHVYQLLTRFRHDCCVYFVVWVAWPASSSQGRPWRERFARRNKPWIRRDGMVRIDSKYGNSVFVPVRGLTEP